MAEHNTEYREFRVGVFLTVTLAAMIGLIIVLGRCTFGGGFTIHVDYRFSGNIHAGAPVKLSGLKVGKVEDVDFLGGDQLDHQGEPVYVRLTLWLEDRVKPALRKDAAFYINTAGVLGAQYVEIVPGTAAEELPQGSVNRGIDPPRTDLVVARLYAVLDSTAELLTDDRDVIVNLLRNSASTMGELNELIKDNRKELGALIASSDRFMGQAAGTLERLNANDTVPRTLANANRFVVTARSTLQTLTPKASAVLSDVQRVSGLVTEKRVERALTAADRIGSAADKTGGVLDRTNTILDRVSKGRGTVGALLVREELYADLREMIRDLKRNPWKFFWKE